MVQRPGQLRLPVAPLLQRRHPLRRLRRDPRRDRAQLHGPCRQRQPVGCRRGARRQRQRRGRRAVRLDRVRRPGDALRLPRITGTAQTGSTLGADDGVWQGVRLSALDNLLPRFVWLRCDSAGAACEAIGHPVYEISATYQPTQQDVGHTIRARVSVEAGLSQALACSEPTAVVR